MAPSRSPNRLFVKGMPCAESNLAHEKTTDVAYSLTYDIFVVSDPTPMYNQESSYGEYIAINEKFLSCTNILQ